MHRVHLDLNVHLRSHGLHTHRPITPSILTDLAYLLAYLRWGRRRLTSINIDEITDIGMGISGFGGAYHTCHVQSVELILNVPSPPPPPPSSLKVDHGTQFFLPIMAGSRDTRRAHLFPVSLRRPISLNVVVLPRATASGPDFP